MSGFRKHCLRLSVLMVFKVTMVIWIVRFFHDQRAGKCRTSPFSVISHWGPVMHTQNEWKDVLEACTRPPPRFHITALLGDILLVGPEWMLSVIDSPSPTSDGPTGVNTSANWISSMLRLFYLIIRICPLFSQQGNPILWFRERYY